MCTECGAIFVGTGALRRHSQKHHPGARLFPKGPKFDPKKHCKAGTPECLACGRAFRTYFFLRRHIEISNCPYIHVLLEGAQQETGSMTELDQVHAAVWLMESCALCGQALAGNKAVKQHLNRQHPEVMSRVQQLITPRLQQHKVMMKKGSTCRYCQTKVDAPGRHSEQCVSLLQTHVLQEAQRQGLDMTPRAYEAQPKKPSKQNKAKAAPQVGLQAPVFVLHGFWLAFGKSSKSLLCKLGAANSALGCS